MNYTQHSPDNELISGCIKQHRLAQRYLYQRYFGKMLGIAMRFSSSRDEANDILNRGFLKVFDKIEKYEPTGSLKVFTFTDIENIEKCEINVSFLE